MSKEATFRVRLRVRIGMTLATDQQALAVSVTERDVTIKADGGGSLRGAEWLIVSCGGFDTKEAARKFGEHLIQIIEVVALCTRLGVDTGENKVTGWINESVARSQGWVRPDERLLPNEHGLMIIPDDGRNRIPYFTGADLTVSAGPDQIVNAIGELGLEGPFHLGDAAASVRNLNRALMNRDPLARIAIAIAIATIEALGQDKKQWSKEQAKFLSEMADHAEKAAACKSEHLEIAAAIRKMHRLGLAEGVRRLLSRIEADNLLDEWKRIYRFRSGIFHGNKHLPEPDLVTLAQETIQLCGKIVLALLKKEGVPFPSVAQLNFPS